MFAGRSAADVLMVSNVWPRDDYPSYGIFVRRQIESLRSLGLSCDVIFVEGYRDRWEYARAAVHMLRLNWSKSRPRIVHGHGGETALAVRWFVRGPVLVSYCGDDLLGTPRADGSLIFASRVRRFVLCKQARLLSATITKSSAMQAALSRKIRERNVVLPNGVDRSLFRPRPRDEARAQLRWPLADRIVLFAADPAVERKRYWLAEHACLEAEQRIGPVRLEVARATAPDEMPIVMAAADCLLLTSSIEGSPNVVKEAVTCGLPVIATDVGDVSQVLRGVEPSWICAPHPESLAGALVECLSDRRRSNGWEASAWLGEEEIGMRVLELYRTLAPDLPLPDGGERCAG
jgi:glycosyltransferase involved in cell wall biosynthesis